MKMQHLWGTVDEIHCDYCGFACREGAFGTKQNEDCPICNHELCHGCRGPKPLFVTSYSNDIDKYYCSGCYEARTGYKPEGN